MNSRQKMLIALKRIRDEGPIGFTYGMCGNVANILKDLRLEVAFSEHLSIFTEIFTQWEEFSGNDEFPVPHPTKAPEIGYYDTVYMWDADATYGAARYRLLDFAIAYLEQEQSQ